jgi:hypothetical protein
VNAITFSMCLYLPFLASRACLESPFCIFFSMDELWVTDGWVQTLTVFSMRIFRGNQLCHGSRLVRRRGTCSATVIVHVCPAGEQPLSNNFTPSGVQFIYSLDYLGAELDIACLLGSNEWSNNDSSPLCLLPFHPPVSDTSSVHELLFSFSFPHQFRSHRRFGVNLPVHY